LAYLIDELCQMLVSIYREYYMALSVSHPVSTRDTNIIPRALARGVIRKEPYHRLVLLSNPFQYFSEWNMLKLNYVYAVFWQPSQKWQTSRKFWKHRIAPLMVTYYVKFYVSIIIHLKVININVRNFNFLIGFYSNPHPLWTPQNMTLTPFTTKLKTLGPTRNIYL
jgi:hypothetical protein